MRTVYNVMQFFHVSVGVGVWRESGLSIAIVCLIVVIRKRNLARSVKANARPEEGA